MTNDSTDRDWSAVNRDARAAERRMEIAKAEGDDAAAAAIKEEVKQLRAEADSLLVEAMTRLRTGRVGPPASD